MIPWHWAVIGGLYAAGAAVFVLHQAFGGGVVYPTKKDGPLKGLIFAAAWPLWAVVILVLIPAEMVLGRRLW